MKYDYRNAMANDIINYILYNCPEYLSEINQPDELREKLWEELWAEDSITGNGGNYYDTEEKCFEYISGDIDLVYEAAREFCIDDNINKIIERYTNKTLGRYLDCTTRCYILSSAIDLALERIKENVHKWKNL